MSPHYLIFDINAIIIILKQYVKPRFICGHMVQLKSSVLVEML